MFTDVYNRGKHFKPYRSSLFQYITDSTNKAHFDQCLAVLVFMGRFTWASAVFSLEIDFGFRASDLDNVNFWDISNTSNKELSRNVLQ